MSVSLHASLNDGNRIPVIGFGTYAPETEPKSKAEEATELAIKVGYRHIDGAYLYGKEAEVGRAIHKKIADGTIRREDLFLTGKLCSTFHRPNLVQKGLQRSLEALNMKYLDLFLIHMPVELQWHCRRSGAGWRRKWPPQELELLTPDQLIRDQFLAGVWSPSLKRALKDRVRADGTVKFAVILQEAIEREQEESNHERAGARSQVTRTQGAGWLVGREEATAPCPATVSTVETPAMEKVV
ncbi:3-alpha-hydroxysteroid dehydrogenase-like [Rana temporaria]|uniref:3-alpha-hydroxysteroid dehydrogenase-like n=1 Tax=Rana temporaria TaxID=8407 RepID=UPI001AAD6A54|nr:3-alpha-hydroxysteroid dehydrogenase-like [Rana temporaria]